MPKLMLGELLVGAGLVTEAEVLTALRGQRASGLPLGHYLVRSGMLSEDQLVRVLSQQLAVPVVDLDAITPHEDAIQKVPAAAARANAIVPFRLEGRVLTVATADPTRDEVADEIRVASHLDVKFALATPSAIDRALERAYVRNARPPGAERQLDLKGAPGPGPLAAASPRSLEQKIAGLELLVARLIGVLIMHDLASEEDFPELQK
jgi:hypothetical protein